MDFGVFQQWQEEWGVTTATDLAARFDKETLAAYREVTSQQDFPLRIVPAMRIQEIPIQEGIS